MADDSKKQDDPTKATEFQRVLKNLLATPPKSQSDVRAERKPAKKKGAAKGSS